MRLKSGEIAYTVALAIIPLVAVPLDANPIVEPAVSVVKLRPQAIVTRSELKLSDVLMFVDADPQLCAAIADKPLHTSPVEGTSALVTHAEIVRRLGELGVNRARVLIQGASQCHVTIDVPSPATAPAALSSPEDRAGLLKSEVSAEGKTLAAALRDFVARELAELGGTPDLEVERSGRDALDLTSPPWEFSIRTGGGEKIGLREFHIDLRRDGRVERTLNVGARVRVVKPVLVARRPLSVGVLVRKDDVALEERVFDRAGEIGLDRFEAVVGMQVERFMPVGEMVREKNLKSVELVQRSRPVSVINADGRVQMRLTGTALDSGGIGDRIRVRLGESRRDRREVRGVVTAPATVKLDNEGL